MPERALRLNGPSVEIVDRCDGTRTVRDLISELQALYSTADRLKIEQDVFAYLARLNEQGAIEFE